MDENLSDVALEFQDPYQPPTAEVISLDCEISSYAPDEGDSPLF